MLIGYARVSTADQTVNLQKDALLNAGCDKIFEDVASGATDLRIGLNGAIQFARTGDCIVVWKLDRLGRSLHHLIEVVTNLENRGIGFKSITEGIDTSTPSGKLVFNIFGSLAQFERELIIERTNAGLAAARSRGRIGGRPTKMTPQLKEMAHSLMNSKDLAPSEIAKTLGVSKASLYRMVKE